MIDDLGGVTSSVVKLALDVSLMKHNLIANNIANQNTPHFIAKSIKFEDYLSESFKSSLAGSEQLVKPQIDDIREMIETDYANNELKSRELNVEHEMVDLAKNTIHYQALLEALAKNGSIIKMAIRGGAN